MKYLLIFEDGSLKLYSKDLTESDYSASEDGLFQIIDLENKTYLTRFGNWISIEVLV